MLENWILCIFHLLYKAITFSRLKSFGLVVSSISNGFCSFVSGKWSEKKVFFFYISNPICEIHNPFSSTPTDKQQINPSTLRTMNSLNTAVEFNEIVFIEYQINRGWIHFYTKTYLNVINFSKLYVSKVCVCVDGKFMDIVILFVFLSFDLSFSLSLSL